jgi:hypothetical protein
VPSEGRAARPFLRAYSRYCRRLLAAVDASRAPSGDEGARVLLQQAIVLAHLVDTCPTDAEARATLRAFSERPDAIGAAARQLREARLEAS